MDLNRDNIDNLTNLWRVMGSVAFPVTDTTMLNYSKEWPNRLWLGWDDTQRDDIYDTLSCGDFENLLSNVGSNKKPIIMPLWDRLENNLISKLEDAGFELLFSQTAMFLNLFQDISFPKRDLRFHDVRRQEAVDIWADIASRSFGYDIHNPVIYNLISRPGVKLILAYNEEQPVGTALLYEDASVLGVHMVTVDPSYRRQGLARKMMQKILGDAQGKGIQNVTLQASVLGKKLYEELGFQEQFEIRNYFRA